MLLACLATAAACDSNGTANDAGDTPREDADGRIDADADADGDGDGDAADADDGGPTACTPDSDEECACSGDVVGSRRCLHDGSAFSDGECLSYALAVWVSPGTTGGDGSRATPYGTFAWFATYADNVEDADPRFVDEAAGNLALSPDSPAYAIPGFAVIPYAEIGIAP